MASGSGDKTIGVWSVQNGKLIKTLNGHSSEVNSVVFSPNGVYLASGSSDKTVSLWRVESGEKIKTFSGHRDAV